MDFLKISVDSVRWSGITVHGFVGTLIGWALLLAAVVGLVWLAERILFAMAAYNDAMAKNNPDAMMWALLIGFLGLIPGIIYLCIRNSSPRTVCCPKCGFWHTLYEPVCPRCGEPNPAAQQQPVNPYMHVYASKAKKELTAAVVCLASLIVVCVIGGIAIAAYASLSTVSFLGA